MWQKQQQVGNPMTSAPFVKLVESEPSEFAE